MTNEDIKNSIHCLKSMIDEALCEECNLYGTTGTDHCEKDCIRTAIEVLEQQKVGKWEFVQYKKPDIGNWHCSVCKRKVLYGVKQIDKPIYNYCPHCGAKNGGKNEK